MGESMTKSREWLLYNAVLSWLSHYGGMGSEYTPQYQKLVKELQFEYEDKLNEQPNNTKTRKRGRPAKRQRTKETPSNPSSTEENKATNQEA